MMNLLMVQPVVLNKLHKKNRPHTIVSAGCKREQGELSFFNPYSLDFLCFLPLLIESQI